LASAALPSGWNDADIGSPALAGSAAYNNGNWTVIGGGSDIWNAADQFNFASTSFSSDGVMIARVLSLQNSDPGSGWSKAGLMFRNAKSSQTWPFLRGQAKESAFNGDLRQGRNVLTAAPVA
jgi:hypothetical protein